MRSLLSTSYSFLSSSFVPSLPWTAYLLSGSLAFVPSYYYQKILNKTGLTQFDITYLETEVSVSQISPKMSSFNHKKKGDPFESPSLDQKFSYSSLKLQTFSGQKHDGTQQRFDQDFLKEGTVDLISPIKTKTYLSLTHPLRPKPIMAQNNKDVKELTPNNTSAFISDDIDLSPVKVEKKLFGWDVQPFETFPVTPSNPSGEEPERIEESATSPATQLKAQEESSTNILSVEMHDLETKDLRSSEVFLETLSGSSVEEPERIQESPLSSLVHPKAQEESAINIPSQNQAIETVQAMDLPSKPIVQEFRDLPRLWHQYPQLRMGNARYILSKLASRRQVPAQEYSYITALIDAVLEFQEFINSVDWNEEDYQEIRREFVLWYLLKIDWRETEYGLHKSGMLGDPCKCTSFLEESFAKEAFLEAELRDDVQGILFDRLREYALINDEEAFLGYHVQAPRTLEEFEGRPREILETRRQKRLDLTRPLGHHSSEVNQEQALPLVRGTLPDQVVGDKIHF